jgi:hypothetical protein
VIQLIAKQLNLKILLALPLLAGCVFRACARNPLPRRPEALTDQLGGLIGRAPADPKPATDLLNRSVLRIGFMQGTSEE